MTHPIPLAISMDVHVPAGVSEGLRRKQIDVRTAQEDSTGRMSDDELLTRSTAIGRVLLTQDAGFLEIAAQWQRQGIGSAATYVEVRSDGSADHHQRRRHRPRLPANRWFERCSSPTSTNARPPDAGCPPARIATGWPVTRWRHDSIFTSPPLSTAGMVAVGCSRGLPWVAPPRGFSLWKRGC